MDVQRALPDSEHVVPLSADDVADKLAAVSQAPNDFPDRYALLGQSENGGVRFFAPKIALILNAFGSCEQTGINRRRADRGADLPHRFAHRIEECAAGVLHEVPAVGDLDGMRKRPGGGFAISASAIACDHCDLAMLPEPSRSRRRFAVGQKRHRPASFKIADDGPVRMVAPPGPIGNADYVQTVRRQATASTDNPQQGVVAHRNHQPPRKACRRSASQRQSKMVDNEIEPGCPSCGRRQDRFAETLGKYLLAAEDGVTSKAARSNDKMDTAS